MLELQSTRNLLRPGSVHSFHSFIPPPTRILLPAPLCCHKHKWKTNIFPLPFANSDTHWNATAVSIRCWAWLGGALQQPATINVSIRHTAHLIIIFTGIACWMASCDKWNIFINHPSSPSFNSWGLLLLLRPFVVLFAVFCHIISCDQ